MSDVRGLIWVTLSISHYSNFIDCNTILSLGLYLNPCLHLSVAVSQDSGTFNMHSPMQPRLHFCNIVQCSVEEYPWNTPCFSSFHWLRRNILQLIYIFILIDFKAITTWLNVISSSACLRLDQVLPLNYICIRFHLSCSLKRENSLLFYFHKLWDYYSELSPEVTTTPFIQFFLLLSAQTLASTLNFLALIFLLLKL